MAAGGRSAGRASSPTRRSPSAVQQRDGLAVRGQDRAGRDLGHGLLGERSRCAGRVPAGVDGAASTNCASAGDPRRRWPARARPRRAATPGRISWSQPGHRYVLAAAGAGYLADHPVAVRPGLDLRRPQPGGRLLPGARGRRGSPRLAPRRGRRGMSAGRRRALRGLTESRTSRPGRTQSAGTRRPAAACSASSGGGANAGSPYDRVHGLQHCQHAAGPGLVQQLQRAARVTAAERHRGVDVGGATRSRPAPSGRRRPGAGTAACRPGSPAGPGRARPSRPSRGGQRPAAAAAAGAGQPRSARARPGSAGRPPGAGRRCRPGGRRPAPRPAPAPRALRRSRTRSLAVRRVRARR